MSGLESRIGESNLHGAAGGAQPSHTVRPDNPLGQVSAGGLVSATLVRLMGVESGRSVQRAANSGRPDMAVTRANETTIRAVVVFVGRAV